MSDNPNKRNAKRDEKKSLPGSDRPSGSSFSCMPQDRFANASMNPHTSSRGFSTTSNKAATDSLNYKPEPKGDAKSPPSPSFQRTSSGTLIFMGQTPDPSLPQGSSSSVKNENSSRGLIAGRDKKRQSPSDSFVRLPAGNTPFILTLSRGPYLRGISQLAEMVKNDRTRNMVEVVIKHPFMTTEYPRVSVFVNLVVPSNTPSNSDPESKRQVKKPKFNSTNGAKDPTGNVSGAVYIAAVRVMNLPDEPEEELFVRYFKGWSDEFPPPAKVFPIVFGAGGYRDLESDSSGSGIDKINPTRLKTALQDVVNMRMQNPSEGTHTNGTTKKSIAVLACTVSEAIRFCYIRDGINAALGMSNPPSFVPPMFMINKWDARGVSLNDFPDKDELNKGLNLKPLEHRNE